MFKIFIISVIKKISNFTNSHHTIDQNLIYLAFHELYKFIQEFILLYIGYIINFYLSKFKYRIWFKTKFKLFNIFWNSK